MPAFTSYQGHLLVFKGQIAFQPEFRPQPPHGFDHPPQGYAPNPGPHQPPPRADGVTPVIAISKATPPTANLILFI